VTALLSREVLFVTPALVQKNASRSRSKGDGDLMQYPSPRDLMAFLEKFFTGREDATFIVGRVHGGRYDPSNFGMRTILISSSPRPPLLRRFSPCCWHQFAACHISARGLTSRNVSPRMICPCHDLCPSADICCFASLSIYPFRASQSNPLCDFLSILFHI
jgi:hypothetical protein